MSGNGTDGAAGGPSSALPVLRIGHPPTHAPESVLWAMTAASTRGTAIRMSHFSCHN